MLFPTITFAAFFVVVWPASWLVARRPRARQVLLLAASWVFYARFDGRFVALLAATIALNHLSALGIARAAARPALQRTLLWGAVSLHLGVLGWFKYYGFFATNLVSVLDRAGVEIHPSIVQVALPVGISFFTFQAISYLIEVRREVLAPATLLEVATWLSFFPTIASGPITRSSELVPQLRDQPDPHLEANRAFWLILRGLFKKMVLASYLASSIADSVFATPSRHSGPEALLGIYAYAVQLYVDFSGYSDMAIGLALLLGVRLPANFDAPYASSSITEFWTRWHMTLSRWLRDFLFTPLALRSRPTTWAACRNLMLVMLLAGLWHGAAWTFVAFGAVHGIALSAERVARQHRRRAGRAVRAGSLPGRIARWLVTFHVICLGWVFFRSESVERAGEVLGRLPHGWGAAPDVTLLAVGVIVAVVAAHLVPRRLPDRLEGLAERLPAPVTVVSLAVALVIVDVLGPEGVPPFIYFGF